MSINDGFNSKKVTFDMLDSLDYTIDKLTSMVSKLTALDNSQNKQCKPKIYAGRWGGQSRYNYDQDIVKIGVDQIVEIEGHNS